MTYLLSLDPASYLTGLALFRHDGSYDTLQLLHHSVYKADSKAPVMTRAHGTARAAATLIEEYIPKFALEETKLQLALEAPFIGHNAKGVLVLVKFLGMLDVYLSQLLPPFEHLGAWTKSQWAPVTERNALRKAEIGDQASVEAACRRWNLNTSTVTCDSADAIHIGDAALKFHLGLAVPGENRADGRKPAPKKQKAPKTPKEPKPRKPRNKIETPSTGAT